jgi:hypothetical protein
MTGNEIDRGFPSPSAGATANSNVTGTSSAPAEDVTETETELREAKTKSEDESMAKRYDKMVNRVPSKSKIRRVVDPGPTRGFLIRMVAGGMMRSSVMSNGEGGITNRNYEPDKDASVRQMTLTTESDM